MDVSQIAVRADKDVDPVEFAALLSVVGWGEAADYPAEVVERSLTAFPFVAHARDPHGRLVGYVSAFSDGAFSTFIGELVVHPLVQRHGIGRRLLEAVEAYSKAVPIYVKPFVYVEGIFLKQGYRHAKRPMSVLFKMNHPAA